ncbi:MAG: winged helix-turn-helix domain-containing protein [Chloroflexota bacterium]|nr:MAG: hypothetical protein KatS3mg045_1542 [Bellilinea sp.]
MDKSSPSAFIIRDMETMRVISDPIRAQIFEALLPQPQTVRQIAEKLGMSASKLYYHFNMLEKFGFIQVQETRQVGNLIEKIYAVTSPTIDVDPSLFSFPSGEQNEQLLNIIRDTIDATREDLLRSLQARLYALEQGQPPKPRRVLLNRLRSNLSEAEAQRLLTKIEELLREFEQSDEGEAPDNQVYSLMIAFYPGFYYPAENPSGGVEE